MKQHVLIELAKKTAYSSTPEMPTDAIYSPGKGYWLSKDQALVAPNSEFGTQTSKKCDQETGEDQKGE